LEREDVHRDDVGLIFSRAFIERSPIENLLESHSPMGEKTVNNTAG
jgi:hypothetical protein